jgi:hypothetical protein
MSKIHQRAGQFGVVTAFITQIGSYFHKKYPVVLMVGLISIIFACDSQPAGDAGSGTGGYVGEGLQIKMSVAELADVSDLVVTGEVISAGFVRTDGGYTGEDLECAIHPLSSSADYFSVRFQVDSYVKGDGPLIIDIAVPGSANVDSSSGNPTYESVVATG